MALYTSFCLNGEFVGTQISISNEKKGNIVYCIARLIVTMNRLLTNKDKFNPNANNCAVFSGHHRQFSFRLDTRHCANGNWRHNRSCVQKAAAHITIKDTKTTNILNAHQGRKIPYLNRNGVQIRHF